MFRQVGMFLELVRFSHTLFALPFALLAAVMAWHVGAVSEPPRAWRWEELAGVLLCMVTARSVAMAANRLADRRIDAGNPRTAGRHLPAGLISAAAVSGFAVVCAAAFVASTLLFLPNRLPLYLSPAVLAFLIAYSFTKRFTTLSHFWLGAALMLAPICAWIAIRGEFVLAQPADLLPAVIVGLAVLAWVAGFDIIYACQDEAFDRRAGLYSLPARLGAAKALRLAAVCHLAMIALLAVLPWLCPQLGLGWIYGLGVAVTAALLVYEHSLVRPDDLARVNLAFFHVNAVLSLGLLAVVTLDLWT
jgi:4-hydroxybenzoate polyprenyltransferase